MTFSLFGDPFTDDTTSVGEGFLNYVRTTIIKAIDGTDGGTYTPSASIVLSGEGLGATVLKGVITLTGASAGIKRRFTEDAAAYSVASPPTFPTAYDTVLFSGALTGTGNIDVVLPDESTYSGRRFRIVIDANGGSAASASFVLRDSGDTADLSVLPADQNGFLEIESDGTDWRTIAWSSNATPEV